MSESHNILIIGSENLYSANDNKKPVRHLFKGLISLQPDFFLFVIAQCILSISGCQFLQTNCPCNASKCS